MSNYRFAPSPTFGITEHPFTTWSDAFTPEELDKIIEIGNQLPLSRASIGADLANTTDPAIRESTVSWVPQTDETIWIYDKLAWVIRQLNGQFYKFDMFGFTEDLQYTIYNEETTGHYTWHIDMGSSGSMSPRKLSLVLQLTDPEEYEGGDLELMTSSDPIAVLKQRGLISVFPSFVLHRVTPVTKGTRRTLVVWACGPEFK
jgi:PKHD-type hydroxylase